MEAGKEFGNRLKDSLVFHQDEKSLDFRLNKSHKLRCMVIYLPNPRVLGRGTF